MRHHVTATDIMRTRIQVHDAARSVHVGVADPKDVLEVFIKESAECVLLDDVRIVCGKELIRGIFPLFNRVVSDSETMIVVGENVKNCSLVGVRVLIDSIYD